jgi:RNA polymerase sigma-70 factor (ECF subfamily)
MMEKVILADSPLARAGAVDFEALVHLHARFVFKVAFAVLRNAEDAEDVVQETFFRAYRSGQAGRVERIRSWLARIAWRLALNRKSQRARRREDADSSGTLHALPSIRPGAEELLLQGEKTSLLERLMQSLPGDFRELIGLTTIEGMTTAEASEILDIPESSVRTRLSRARQLLKVKLAALTEGSYGS